MASAFRVPGASTKVKLGDLENISGQHSTSSASTSSAAHVPPTSDNRGKGLLCGALGCFSRPEVEDVKKSPLNPTHDQHPAIAHLSSDQQRQFLQTLHADQLTSKPKAQAYLRMYTKAASRNDRNDLVQTAFQYLANAKGLPQIEVVTWIDLFTLMAKDSKTVLEEGSNILFGFHSLWAKHAHDEKVLQYLEVAIQLTKDKMTRKSLLENIKGPWLREIMNPKAGPSEKLSTFADFKTLTGYEDKINKYFPSFEHGTDDIEDLRELEVLVQKGTQGVPAQSKTAGIILLYHMSQSLNQNLNRLGRQSISNLLNAKEGLFPHDAQLLDNIGKKLGISASTSSASK